MTTLYILRGIPAAGKSTFAKELLAKNPGKIKRVNRDDLRMMFDNDFNTTGDKYLNEIQVECVKSALRKGYDVVVDNTHIVERFVHLYHKIAKEIGDITVIEKGFNVSVDECLRRNALRTGVARVPDNVIHEMAKVAGITKGRKFVDKETYHPPVPSSLIIQNPKLPKAIICDLDGTLSLLNGRNPYDATHADKDLPNPPVIACVKAMFKMGYHIIFMSGREECYRGPSERFIEHHLQHVETRPACDPCGPIRDSFHVVIPHDLFMRPTGDMRKDAVVKRELFEANVAGKYFVEFVLDDRNQVVQGWRAMGLTCMQVAPGDF